MQIQTSCLHPHVVLFLLVHSDCKQHISITMIDFTCAMLEPKGPDLRRITTNNGNIGYGTSFHLDNYV